MLKVLGEEGGGETLRYLVVILDCLFDGLELHHIGDRGE
jgi:hypothetical protein